MVHLSQCSWKTIQMYSLIVRSSSQQQTVQRSTEIPHNYWERSSDSCSVRKNWPIQKDKEYEMTNQMTKDPHLIATGADFARVRIKMINNSYTLKEFPRPEE